MNVNGDAGKCTGLCATNATAPIYNNPNAGYGASSSGGGGSGAANNGTPWYKNTCFQNALLKGAGSAALDAIGLLPEGGAVAATFSLWHGAAAVSQGTKLLQGVKVGAGIIPTASAGSEGNWFGGVTGALALGASLAKAAPVVGQVISAVSIVGDFVDTGMEIANCH